MLDISPLETYLNKTRVLLGGDSWIAQADKAQVGLENVGGIARRYAIHCYMTGVAVTTCVRNIKKKFPETK